ncbi:sensor histidine kinase [Candidatus Poribacteria bacterium]|nr:sensor histidine kinase [Candidatus Poribacteria bacterium]
MKTESKIIASSIILGLLAWIIDAILDYLFFYPGTFLGLLILRMPRHEAYIRSVILALFILFGVTVSRLFTQRRRVEQALCEARAQLERRVQERTTELRESENKLQSLSSHLLTAQETERKRISYELHDELGQALMVLKLHIRSIAKKLGHNRAALKEDCDEVLRFVDQIVENVRRLSHDLSPALLEDLGLTAALKSLARDFSRHSDTRILFEMNAIDHLFPERNQILLYRIFQEAFTNAGKHGDASRVSVVVANNEREVVFRIEDDGKGFDTKQAETTRPGGGIGLTAMRQRVKMLGGSLAVTSHEGKGTRIELAVPINPEAVTNESIPHHTG